MPVNKEHIFDSGIYFITFTTYKWIPLFHIANAYDVVYNWFNALKAGGHSVLGYVIMPNHIHALIGYNKSPRSINTLVGNGKRFMAYDIVNRLQQTGNNALLKTLQDGVNLSERKRGKLHEVFKDSFDIKLCRTHKFVKQKLDYMHSNPITKKWSLVTDPTLYEHSSAKFYITGVQGNYTIIHTNDWILENWVELPADVRNDDDVLPIFTAATTLYGAITQAALIGHAIAERYLMKDYEQYIASRNKISVAEYEGTYRPWGDKRAGQILKEMVRTTDTGWDKNVSTCEYTKQENLGVRIQFYPNKASWALAILLYTSSNPKKWDEINSGYLQKKN